jgi:hypothetical protein
VSNLSANEKSMGPKPGAEKPSITLPGTVDKVIPSLDPSEPDKAQIVVEGADHLYREIRVTNTLQDAKGNEVSLKQGAEVEVTIEAEASATQPKNSLDWQLRPL